MEATTSAQMPATEVGFEGWRSGVLGWSIIVIAIGILTNSLLLRAYHQHPELLSPTHLLILNQGITDLLSCIVVPFYTYMNYTAHGMQLASEEKFACVIGIFLLMLALWASLFNLLLLSLGRLTTIQFPFHYARLVTEQRVKVVIVLVWTGMVILLLIPLFGLNKWSPHVPCSAASVLPSVYFINVFLLMSLMILILVALINLVICGIVIRKRRVLPIAAEPPEPGQKSQYKLTKMLLIVVGVFYLCWLPYVMVSAVPLLFRGFLLTNGVPPWLSILLEYCKVPLAVNGAVNPLIVAWKNAALRKVFKKALRMPVLDENNQPAT
jgi:hypothetical protein